MSLDLNDFALNSAALGVVVSIAAYEVGVYLQRKYKSALLNPLLLAVMITIVFVLACNIDYDNYNSSASFLTYLLTPATVALAVPLYQQLAVLKKYSVAIIVGISAGALTSLTLVYLLSKLLQLDKVLYLTLLPKSITTAIGIGVAEEIGAIITLTVTAIILTGILGNMIGLMLFKIAKIVDPIARGVALGSASHAIGTAKAMELGELEGAISSLALVLSGVFTVILTSFYVKLF